MTDITSIGIFSALSYISPIYIEEADADEQQTAGPHISKTIKTILIAAVIAALLGAAAYATGFFGLADRTYKSETGSSIVTPNGYIGSDEYNATVEWFEYLDNEGVNNNSDRDFAGTDRERSICRIYNANDKPAMDRLNEIANKYGLLLYSDSLTVADDDDFSRYTGIDRISELLSGVNGYVFADGSFKAEFRSAPEGAECCTVNKICVGSLYPYNGVAPALQDYEEQQYKTAMGYELSIACWKNGRAAVCWNTDEAFITVTAEMDVDTAKRIADSMDLSALCEANGTAEAILAVDRGAEANPDAVQVFESFYSSAVLQANREFSEWFGTAFYGDSFTGVHGQKGYEDIDAMLEALAEKYALDYATSKSDGQRTEYSNGAWREDGGDYTLHYIPKTALYTGLDKFAPFSEYSKIWKYETISGETVYIAAQGPEKESCVYILYETHSAYVVMTMYTWDIGMIEAAADATDWKVYQ